jgi:hypothetical protein
MIDVKKFSILSPIERDTDTKNAFQITLWGDAFDILYEPPTYLKMF